MDIVLEKMHYKLDKYRKKTIKRSRSNLKWWGGERERERDRTTTIGMERENIATVGIEIENVDH
jgi:hypothetical protein